MEEKIVTDDLGDFGYREIEIAKELLDKMKHVHFLGDGIHLMFNTNSGNVFLSDEDFNTGLINPDGELEQFYSCSETGEEGFISELKKTGSKSCKKEIREMGY